MVCPDTSAGRPCLEAVAAGAELARHLRLELALCVIGSNLGQLAGKVCGLAARIYHLRPEDSILGDLPALTALLDQATHLGQPATLVFPPTLNGADLAARVAARRKRQLFSGCVKFACPDGENLVCHKPVYGGKASACLRVPREELPFFTIARGMFEAARPRGTAEVPVQSLDVKVDWHNGLARRPQIVDLIPGNPGSVDVGEAERIVCGGGGLVDPEGRGFQLLTDLAQVLGAAPAGSRALRDAGRIGLARQIGQTGKSVAPELLISCGVSGSKYHTVGMRDAQVVVAINKDPNAPIFKVADLGVLGDVYEVLPRLIAKMKDSQHRGGV